jgi:hypothetical protein
MYSSVGAATAAAGGASLAMTGSSTGLFVAIAVGFILSGLLMMRGARLRRTFYRTG